MDNKIDYSELLNYKTIGEINEKLFESGHNRDKSVSLIKKRHDENHNSLQNNEKSRSASHQPRVRHSRIPSWQYQYTDLNSYLHQITNPKALAKLSNSLNVNSLRNIQKLKSKTVCSKISSAEIEMDNPYENLDTQRTTESMLHINTTQTVPSTADMNAVYLLNPYEVLDRNKLITSN